MQHLLTPSEQRLNHMVMRAHCRIERIRQNLEDIKKIPFLSLCDILDLFLRKKLFPEDMQFVAHTISNSSDVQHIIDLLIDATLWAKSKEGEEYIESLNKSALS